jgi:hypothetical protein
MLTQRFLTIQVDKHITCLAQEQKSINFFAGEGLGRRRKEKPKLNLTSYFTELRQVEPPIPVLGNTSLC